MWRTTLPRRSVVLCLPGFLTLLGVLLYLPTIASAQHPTATINILQGTVFVSIQSKEPVAAAVGMVLQAGDTIQTQAGAEVLLLLSEGSELRLGQNTKIDIAVLSQKPKTGARTSRIKLFYGKIRAFLSPGHQQKGSTFTVETPNAEAGVKFSQPVIEASYDRITGISVFKAYTVALTLTNRATSKVRQVPQGTQAVIQKESVTLTPITSEIVPTARDELLEKPPEQAPVTPESLEKPSEPVTPPSPPATKEQPVAPPPTQSDVLQQARSATRAATSTSAPISVGATTTEPIGETAGTEGTGGATNPETSTNPSPGVRPETAETRTYHAITITIRTQ